MPTRRDFLTRAASLSVMTAGSAYLPQAPANATPAATSMRRYAIPNTDLVVSRIAYGTAMLLTDQRSSDFVRKTTLAMRTAYEHGVTFFDLADVYGAGQSEMAMGELLKRSPGLRDKITIQSKCGARFAEGVLVGDPDEATGLDFQLSRSHIVNAVNGTLKRLEIDYLDVLLLHAPDPLTAPEEVGQAFDDLKGKVRYFGLSNHNVVQIELLRKYVKQPLIANQVRLSLAHHTAITGDSSFGGLVDYCRTHDMQVQAYSPLKLNGRLTLLNPPPDATPEVKQLAESLADVGRKYDVSPAAIMLAWLLHHPAGIVPVIGASKPEHVIDNSAADRIKLSREEWITLLRQAAAIS